MVWKSQNREFSIFGKAKTLNSDFWKNQHSEFQSLESQNP